MATQRVYNGDGATQVFTVPFTYQKSTEIAVFVNDVRTPFTLASVYAIQITPAPAAGTRVRVQRVTAFENPAVDFQDGAVLTERDLDTQTLQLFQRLQEVADDLGNLRGRAVLFPDGEPGVVFPSRVGTPGKYLGFDAAGNLTPISGPADSTGLRTELASPSLGGALIAYRHSLATAQRTLKSRLDDMGFTSGDLGIPADADATVALQAGITAGDITILKRDYKISGTITLPVGRKVRIEPGTRFLWTGPAPKPEGPWVGIFRVTGDNEITSTGGSEAEWIAEAPTEMQFLSIVIGFSVKNIRIVGAFGLNMTRSYFNLPDGYAGYDAVVTTTMKANPAETRTVNTNRNLNLLGGGCDFPNHTPSGALGQPERAGDYMLWAEDSLVEQSRFGGCYCGVQYWGGDSGLLPFQDMGRLGPDAERKSKNITIRSCVSHRTGAGFWGSMGDTILIEDCASYVVGDVAHDHEGSVNVVVKNSHAEDVQNGALATFSYTKNIVFQNCTVRQSKKEWPIFRVYNSSQTQLNENVTILGGNFICTDPTGPSTIDSNFGPARSITVLGATLDNVVISLNTLNNNRVIVKDNVIRLPVRVPGGTTAINVGGLTDTGYGPAVGVIAQNVISSNVNQPGTMAAINTTGVDFNSNASFRITGNTIKARLDSQAGAGISLTHGSGNGGQTTFVVVDGNQLDGPILAVNSGPGTGTNRAIGNFNTRGDPVNLS